MQTTKTILLVEDDAELRLLVRKVLEKNGYSVVAAEDSVVANAQARMRGGIIDLVLADINLPGLTGGEYADFLKSINPNLKILYMSGAPLQDSEALRHLRRKDASFIGKPFSLEELVMAVRKALGEVSDPLPKKDGPAGV